MDKSLDKTELHDKTDFSFSRIKIEPSVQLLEYFWYKLVVFYSTQFHILRTFRPFKIYTFSL